MIVFTIEGMMATSATNQSFSTVEQKSGQPALRQNPIGDREWKREPTAARPYGATARGNASKTDKASKHLLEATRNFGCIQRPSREETDIYKELFYELIERVSASDKRLISAMLARGVFTPRPVALYLAQDKVDIAAPFLLYSPVLGDLDLRAIAKKKGAEHAAIVAKRRLPMDNFTVSTLHDVISSPEKPVVQTPPVQEEKFLEPIAETPEVSKSSKWLEGEEILALASIGGRLGKKEKSAPLTTGMAARTSKPDQTSMQLPKAETRKLLQLARQRQTAELARYIEELCGLESASTLKLIGSQKTELTYLVKAFGLSAPHDIQLLMMLAPAISRDISVYRETKKMLLELNIGICRMIFNEIGARFDMGNSGKITTGAAKPETGFNQAVQQRRASLERPSTSDRQSGKTSRFSFEQSFLAAG